MRDDLLCWTTSRCCDKDQISSFDSSLKQRYSFLSFIRRDETSNDSDLFCSRIFIDSLWFDDLNDALVYDFQYSNATWIAEYSLGIPDARYAEKIDWTHGNPSSSFQGGRDTFAPLQIQRVNPNSLAEQFGMQTNDYIVRIGSLSTEYLDHQAAQEQMKRFPTVLELTLQRYRIDQLEQIKVHPFLQRSATVRCGL